MALSLIKVTPKQALNKAFLKVRPLRSEIDLFKANLITLLNKVNEAEREENQKNHIRDFLRDTYYKGINEINTKGTQDLVIHIDKTDQSKVGVIIEAKRPSNKADWISAEKPNAKALHELVLYYMRERVDEKNIDIKYLVATNIYEWYIIESSYFDKVFYGNRNFVKQYEEWRDGKKVTKDTNLFYNEIAKPFIESLEDEIPATYFDIRDYEKELRNADKADDKKLIALQKLLSSYHLMRVPFANDSNELNNRFYKELLHIIGLEEVKEGGKQIIRRKTKDASDGSMIENTINILKTEDILVRMKNKQIFGDTKDEQLYSIALELNLTWINRILFLKLLEGQLLSYHKNDKRYNFLNKDVVFDYDEIYKLFHQVLARTMDDRSGAIKQKYQWVPYLNSSLFEINELEHQTIKINSLDDHSHLDVMNGSILSHYKNKSINPLQYLYEFLDAYDFASEGVEEVQEDNRTLINASILGKIFEKINGYKDGSIYTPGFITMYMCRQAIRRAVVQKFKDVFGWNINEFGDIRNYIADRKSKADLLEFNALINSLRLCDPAVGSGHFLVSGLNELVLIKYELGILCDSDGIRITDYDLTIENDELIVTYTNGDIFEYQIINGKPKSKEDQRLQKTLFHEKQTIIENCLFGVDINPNSVKICRLRLWIELLKNAYYKEESGYTELETLPNIDINIKCGNSLISRFPINADLGTALKSIKYDIKTYRAFVQDYKNCKDREAKRGIEEIINAIKNDFRSEIGKKDKDVLKLNALSGELFNLVHQQSMFETEKEQNTKKVKIQKLETEINALSAKIEEIKNNAIYRDAFEWRFEFPEVLDDEGNFVGFDVVVGNPPYIKEYDNKQAFDGIRHLECYQGKMDLWYLFGDLGLKLLKQNYYICFIATNNWVTNAGASNFRNIILKSSQIISIVDFNSFMVFENASIQTMVMLFKKNKEIDNYTFRYGRMLGLKNTHSDIIALLTGVNTDKSQILSPKINRISLINKSLTFNSNINSELLFKIKAKQNFILDGKSEVAQGIVPNPDIVNKRNIVNIDKEKILKYNISVGDGVFIVPKNFFKSLDDNEKNYLKPIFEPYLTRKYYVNDYDKEIIYLTKSEYQNDAPGLIDHLFKYKEIMDQRRENQQGKLKYFHLHWPRDKFFFEDGPKILCVRKCSTPTFAYTEEEAYVMMSFNIIRTQRINLKFLTGLLNSKIIAFWLKGQGKMQGNAFQIDKEPLLEIPICMPLEPEIKVIEAIVKQIISNKKENQDTTDLESEIDRLVYELYGLTEDEIKVVEGN